MYLGSNCKQDNLEKSVAYICNYDYSYFLNKVNMLEICLGYKIKDRFYTNQFCIEVIVSKKS